MPDRDQLDVIASEGRRLLGFAKRDPGRRVPHYPSWTQRDLVEHTASIHARTEMIVRTLAQERPPVPELPAGRDPLDWYEETLGAMVEALGAADPQAHVWTITPQRTIATWRRRMLVETGVHRWDAQQAIEDPEPLLPSVSSTGLDEFVHLHLPELGELPTLELRAEDLGRSWTFGTLGPPIVVSGTGSDLYLRLMARPGADLPAGWERAVDGLVTAAG